MRTFKRGRERGAAAVEMAIVLPVLIALVFGIIDFSRIFSGIIAAQQGAREGVRLAALAPNYTSAQAKTRAEAAGANPMAGNMTAVVTMCPNANDYAAVAVTFHFSGILWQGGAGKDYTETAQMRCGG